MTRFLSFSTGARSHSIAIVCHVPEDRLPLWRPRVDALIEASSPRRAISRCAGWPFSGYEFRRGMSGPTH